MLLWSEVPPTTGLRDTGGDRVCEAMCGEAERLLEFLSTEGVRARVRMGIWRDWEVESADMGERVDSVDGERGLPVAVAVLSLCCWPRRRFMTVWR